MAELKRTAHITVYTSTDTLNFEVHGLDDADALRGAEMNAEGMVRSGVVKRDKGKVTRYPASAVQRVVISATTTEYVKEKV